MKRVKSGIVYKYLHPDRLDVLESGTIRFTQVDALNDPFEAYPNMEEYRQGLKTSLIARAEQNLGTEYSPYIEHAAPILADHYSNQIQTVLGQLFSFLSLSQVSDSLVMWAHYADSHKGYVIGFHAESEFFQPGNGKSVHGLCEIEYSLNRPVLPAEGLKAVDHTELERLNAALLFQKSEHWSYEKELRHLADPNQADNEIEDSGGERITLFSFPSDSVAEVLIGLRMDEHTVRKISKVVRDKYKEAKLFRAVMHESEYGLRFIPFSG